MKTGCRPFVEVFSGQDRVLSTGAAYDQIRQYEYGVDAHIHIPMVGRPRPLTGDVTICVYHARWGRVQGKMLAIPMFSISFHTNFLDPSTNAELQFARGDLDEMAEDGKYPEPFRVRVKLQFEDSDASFGANAPEFWGYDDQAASARLLVSDKEEKDTIYRQLGIQRASQPSPDSSPAHPMGPSVIPTESRVANSSFFANLQWDNGDSAVANNALDARRNRDESASPAAARKSPVAQLGGYEAAEAYERMYGIRVGADEPTDEDSAKYQFDCDRPQQQPAAVEPAAAAVVHEVDLLNLGSASNPASATIPFDPFAHFENRAPHKSASANVISANAGQQSGGAADEIDLLGGLDGVTNAAPFYQQPQQPFGASHMVAAPDLGLHVSAHGMPRNVSAPALPQQQPAASDPFAALLESLPSNNHCASATKNVVGSAGGSGSSTPQFNRPNYSRSNFSTVPSASSTGVPLIGGMAKPKVQANAFDDLLSSHGFEATTRIQANQAIGDLRRQEEVKDMDPVAVKISDWVKGKERNIRALLGSLNDVLWEGADRWEQPTMAQLLTAAQVKKSYRKACLVAHPDKQTGTEQEALARAIFTELNDAWNDFEDAGCPSL